MLLMECNLVKLQTVDWHNLVKLQFLLSAETYKVTHTKMFIITLFVITKTVKLPMSV